MNRRRQMQWNQWRNGISGEGGPNTEQERKLPWFMDLGRTVSSWASPCLLAASTPFTVAVAIATVAFPIDALCLADYMAKKLIDV